MTQHTRDFPNRKTPHTALRIIPSFEKLQPGFDTSTGGISRVVDLLVLVNANEAPLLFKDELSVQMTQEQVAG
jgi:hypothetical protein